MPTVAILRDKKEEKNPGSAPFTQIWPIISTKQNKGNKNLLVEGNYSPTVVVWGQLLCHIQNIEDRFQMHVMQMNAG